MKRNIFFSSKGRRRVCVCIDISCLNDFPHLLLPYAHGDTWLSRQFDHLGNTFIVLFKCDIYQLCWLIGGARRTWTSFIPRDAQITFPFESRPWARVTPSVLTTLFTNNWEAVILTGCHVVCLDLSGNWSITCFPVPSIFKPVNREVSNFHAEDFLHSKGNVICGEN